MREKNIWKKTDRSKGVRNGVVSLIFPSLPLLHSLLRDVWEGAAGTPRPPTGEGQCGGDERGHTGRHDLQSKRERERERERERDVIGFSNHKIQSYIVVIILRRT